METKIDPIRDVQLCISAADETAEKSSRSSSTSVVTPCKQYYNIIKRYIHSQYTEPASVGFPMRFQMVAMLFTAIMVSFLLRSSMSMNILAMVQPSRNDGTNSTIIMPDVRSHSPFRHTSAITGILRRLVWAPL